MDTLHTINAQDLPDDILELIDHTTRGVQRLYESTKRVEASARQQAKSKPSSRRGSHRGDGLYSVRCEVPNSTALSGSTDAFSGTSTANTTLSLDARYRRSSAPHIAQGHHSSSTSMLNLSAAGTDSHNLSSSFNQKWKETFRSLLGGVVASNPNTTTTPTPMPTKTSFVEGVNTTDGKGSCAIHDVPQARGTATSSKKERSNSVTQEWNDGMVECLRRQIEEQAVLHQSELSDLRTEHSRELERHRRHALEERQKGEDEVRTQLQASFGVKQKLLQVELEEERLRVRDARLAVEERSKTIDHLRGELEITTNQNLSLRNTLDTKAKEVTELQDALIDARGQRVVLEEEVNRRKGDLEESKRREKLATEREKEILALVSKLESQLREQDQRSHEELRRLEAEFSSTAGSYQKLIGEATERLTILEKMERKYRTLKELNKQQKQQHEELILRIKSTEVEKQQLEKRVEELQRDVESLRLQVARKEHEMREERVAHHTVVEGLTKQLEEHEVKAHDEHETLQKDASHAKDCAMRLQREMEGLKRQLEEEQKHSKTLLVKLEQSAARHQEDMTSARQAASSYQRQSEDILTSLRRQLRDKDAKLEAIAKTATEPLHRLRSQLEDERSKRAHLEEQFNRYKQKAKAAEEAALREIRREQHRVQSAPRPRSRSEIAVRHTSSLHRSEEATSATYSIPSAETNGATTPTGRCAVGTANSLSLHSRCDNLKRSFAISPPSGAVRAVCDSVGSISNISCVSPYCNSHGAPNETAELILEDEEEYLMVPSHTLVSPLSNECSVINIEEKMQRHKQVLQEFHESAAEVFRKITGNRDEFLAKCASVVRTISHHSTEGESHSNGFALGPLSD